MRNQHGFASIYLYLGAAVVMGIMALGWKLTATALDRERSAFATFKAQVEANGKIAEAAKIKQEAQDKEKKEKADAENKRTTDALRVTIKRLRDANNTSGGSVSRNPPGSRCPDGQTCFDTAEYRRADGEFVAEARGLADEGAALETDMATVRKWAQER